MKEFKSHITILLLGILLYPIVFQSVHLVHHHLDDHHICEHSNCDVELKQDDNRSANKSFSELETLCPICEYEFPVKDLPIHNSYHSFVDCKYSILIIAIKKLHSLEDRTIKSPRAPPALFA
nr:hypothetical protein [uncultured Carboxylicivirga sp.]